MITSHVGGDGLCQNLIREWLQEWGKGIVAVHVARNDWGMARELRV